MTEHAGSTTVQADLPDRIELTAAGREDLERQLTALRDVQRPALARRIQRATLFMDSDRGAEAANVARYDLDMLDKQIAHLEAVLERAEVIQSRSDAATVQPGSQFTIRYEDGTEETLTLVGPLEADPERGHVSIESPAGQALLGKAPGANVTVGEGEEALSLVVAATELSDASVDTTPAPADLS